MKKLLTLKLLTSKILLNEWVDIAVILVTGTVVLSWFGGSYFLKSVDSYFGLNPPYQLFTTEYVWKYVYSTGYPWPDVNQLPFNLFWFALYRLGLSLVDAQKVVLYFLFSLSSISMYIFLKVIFPSKNASVRYSRLVSSFFYTMNPFSMSFFWWHQLLWEFTWVAFPLAFALILKVLEAQTFRKVVEFNAILGFVLIAFAPGLNLGTLAVMGLTILLYVAYRLKKEKRKGFTFSKMIFTLGVQSLLCFWFVAPLITNISTTYSQATVLSTATSYEQFFDASRFSSILNALRLMNNHILFRSFLDETYYRWSTTFLYNPVFIFLTFAVPILAYLAPLFLIKKGNNHSRGNILFFLLVSLFAVFIMKGGSPPLGEINYAFLSLPFGEFFRHPDDKFAMLFVSSLSVLLTFSLMSVLNIKRKKLVQLTAFALIVFLVIYTYPFWNGDVIWQGGNYIPSVRVTIPKDYYDLGEFLRTDSKSSLSPFRIVALPTTPSGESAYRWESGIQPNSDPILEYFAEGTSIVQFRDGYVYSDRVVDITQTLLNEGQLQTFLKFASASSIKYVVLHKDWDSNFIKYVPDATYYEEFLNPPPNATGLVFVFNGNNSYIQLSNLRELPTGKLTVEMMIHPSSLQKGYLFGMGGALGIYQDDGLYAAFNTIDGYRYTNSINIKPLLNASIGMHFSFTYDEAQNRTEFRVNGVKFDASLKGGSIALLKNVNDIITVGTDGKNFYKGNVSFIRLYNDTFSDDTLQEMNLHNTASPILEISPNAQIPAYIKIKNQNISTIQYRSPKHVITQRLDFGKLILYKIEPHAPLIYIADEIITVTENYSQSSLLSIIGNSEFTSNPVILFRDSAPEEVFALTQKLTPNPSDGMAFKQINPTQYDANVTSTNNNGLVLVFADSFSDGWKAYINNEEVPEEQHFISNGYANAWYINKTGNYNVKIEYAPQKLYYLGFAVSFSTYLILLIILFLQGKPRKILASILSRCEKGAKEKTVT